MDRVAEIRPKIGLDDYLIHHAVEEFKKLPVHPVRKLTIAEMLETLNADDSQEIREIIKRISEVKFEVEKAKYIKKLHEITGVPIRSIQKDIQSFAENTFEENNKASDCPYRVNEEGYLCLLKPFKEGQISLRLANFTAQITEEITEDNGIDILHTYIIEGQLNNELLSKITVPASQFPSLNWLCKWGSRVIIEPGQSIKDNVRHAIQVMSTDTVKYTCYAHTGWREIYGKMAYMTSNGAIGAENVKVKLSNELQRYCLPLIPQNEIEAIMTSLSFLKLGNHRITLPLWCLLYLSILTTLLDPVPNFSAYVHGRSGVFKTELSVTMLKHFGNLWAASTLPNFSDTANSLEKRAFLLKDTLLVLDDYHPDNRKADAQQKENLAQRLIRSYSNRTGRGRLNADTTDKGRYEPRGMLLITGEELVTLQSTLARLMVINISEGDIDKNRLTEIQQKTHLLPHAMASFVIWVKDHIQDIQVTFKAKFPELRAKAYKDGIHKKLPEQVAFLQFALETVISWIVDKGVMTKDEAAKLSREGWNIFLELCTEQSQRILREDPIEKFFEILRTLITQNKVKIKNKNTLTENTDNGHSVEFIGYYDDDYFYFLGQAVWHTLQKYCLAEGIHFPFKKDTFYQMLKDKKILTTRDNQTATPVYLEGKTRRVLMIAKKFLYESEYEIENTNE